MPPWLDPARLGPRDQHDVAAARGELAVELGPARSGPGNSAVLMCPGRELPATLRARAVSGRAVGSESALRRRSIRGGDITTDLWERVDAPALPSAFPGRRRPWVTSCVLTSGAARPAWSDRWSPRRAVRRTAYPPVGLRSWRTSPTRLVERGVLRPGTSAKPIERHRSAVTDPDPRYERQYRDDSERLQDDHQQRP